MTPRKFPPKPSGLCPARILEITRSKGIFSVSWRYRDATLRAKCRRMARDGLLKRVRCAPGEDQYRLPAMPEHEADRIAGYAVPGAAARYRKEAPEGARE